MLEDYYRDQHNQNLLKEAVKRRFKTQGLLFNLVQISYQKLPVCFLSKVTTIGIRVVLKTHEIPLIECFLRTDLVRSNINMVPSVAHMYWTLYQYWQRSRVRKIKKCFYLIYNDRSFASLLRVLNQTRIVKYDEEKDKKKSLKSSILFFSILPSGDEDKVRKETQTSVYAFLLK